MCVWVSVLVCMLFVCKWYVCVRVCVGVRACVYVSVMYVVCACMGVCVCICECICVRMREWCMPIHGRGRSGGNLPESEIYE